MAVEIEWRTIQFFVSPDGISELSQDALNGKKLRCSCAEFSRKAKCVHVAYARGKMRANDGAYPLTVEEDTPEEIIEAAFDGPVDEFRNFILNYGRIYVL